MSIYKKGALLGSLFCLSSQTEQKASPGKKGKLHLSYKGEYQLFLLQPERSSEPEHSLNNIDYNLGPLIKLVFQLNIPVLFVNFNYKYPLIYLSKDIYQTPTTSKFI
jgi:hypothetical protein